jgi:phosphohistidine phosphatase
MPRLLLLRHAKSSRDDPALADFDRPLAPRGRRAAGMVGEHIARHQMAPDRILCSSSRRTRETLAGLLPWLGGECDIRLTRVLYEPRETYAGSIASLGLTARTLLLIGHNPAMQETAGALIGSGNQALAAEIAARFPTAGLAVIDFDIASWRDLRPGTGRIVAFFRPRDLELVGAGQGQAVDDE